ncbi:hypothetical protein TAMA11512_04260 [Selenomonas sp. TAMA-11512]|uniref:VirK/YbjX family protein n=1 Tax=Selenomonas sp. TAMA-11512 TaxID=3095337 RepID=UPI003093337E|nr:hypothetical protein TAMA11512_04260 [Selenomonas sp. TAMA-11512]
MRNIIALGKRIYDMDNPREQRRYVVFVARAMLHRGAFRALCAWFQETPLRKKSIKESPFPLEQVTRAFFYKGATFQEKAELVKGHFSYLEDHVKSEWFLPLTSVYEEPVVLWQDAYGGESFRVTLHFGTGQRKEGLLAINMLLGQREIYQMIFWLGRNSAGEGTLTIGAMQGPNVDEAKELIKALTKTFFGYRTKNLILLLTQSFARALGVKHMYAVSNDGYYAMNHMRRNRKLQTDFGAFWEEAGGKLTDDARFYELPLIEERKSIEEVKSQKRNLYRKRFAVLDAVEAIMAGSLEKLLKQPALHER